MKRKEAYAYAWQRADRNPDGSVIEDSLVRMLAEAIDFDEAKERRGLAQRIIARRKRPGQTAPAGEVVFPGLEHYDYEPDRLVADHKGNLIRNAEAKVDYKIADSERSQADLEKAVARQARDKREADHYSRWAVQELANGRAPREVTWDNCLRETGLWKDTNGDEPDVDDDDTDEVEEPPLDPEDGIR